MADSSQKVRIKLKGRTSAEKPGTRISHFGVPFIVQKNQTLVSEQPSDIAEMLVKAERAEYVDVNYGSVEEEEDDDVDEEAESPDFTGMTKEELVNYAQDRGVELNYKSSKPELVAACEDVFKSDG